jgi:hypothetical protein
MVVFGEALAVVMVFPLEPELAATGLRSAGGNLIYGAGADRTPNLDY